MSEYRVTFDDFCMADAMPFQQHHECRTVRPIAEDLSDEFFLAVKSNLRSGDRVEICRYTDKSMSRLAEIALVRIIEVGADFVEFLLLGEIEIIPPRAVAQDAPAADEEERYVEGNGLAKWINPQRRWGVFVDDAKIVDLIEDKVTAERIASGDIPLPKAA